MAMCLVSCTDSCVSSTNQEIVTTNPPQTVSDKTQNNQGQPRKKNRRWLKIVGGLGLGLFLALLGLPMLLGSRWIYEPLIQRLAQDRFRLEVDSVKLRWFSPLEFQGISISDLNTSGGATLSKPLISIRTVKSDRSLFGYLLNGRNLGRIEISEPKIDIALLEDGSNLERLVKSLGGTQSTAPTEKKKQPQLDLDLAIRSLSVQIEPNDGSKPHQVIPPMDADVSYRAVNQDAQLIVQPMEVLNQATLTPEFVRLGVGLAVPLLAKSAWFDGQISLRTKEIRVPLTNPMESKGEATLTLHQVRSGPSEPLIVGALDALANLRGKEPSHELVFVDGSEVVIRVAEGRVFHSGLEAGLPKLDQRLQIATEGYVGMVDRSLDLSVEIPIPIEQLARREKVQQLGVPRVKLPVGGTLDDPEIKWNVMRGESAMLLTTIASQLQSDAPITSTIVDAIGDVTEGRADEAIATAVDFVKALRQRRAQEKAKQSENVQPSSDTAEPEKKRPFRDALKKVLKGE
jgi:hypothetical protein